MTTTTTLDRTDRPTVHIDGRISGELYQYHGFTVFDLNGERVGIVDWVWSNDLTGEGDHIGLQLQWLRGKARAVPAAGARIDRDLGMVVLPFARDQVSRAPRFRIDRTLSRTDRDAIAAHFTRSTGTVQSSLRIPLAA